MVKTVEKSKKEQLEELWASQGQEFTGDKISFDELIGETFEILDIGYERHGQIGGKDSTYHTLSISYEGNLRILMTGAAAVIRKVFAAKNQGLLPVTVIAKKVKSKKGPFRYNDIELAE